LARACLDFGLDWLATPRLPFLDQVDFGRLATTGSVMDAQLLIICSLTFVIHVVALNVVAMTL
jgi:hypothetical protein